MNCAHVLALSCFLVMAPACAERIRACVDQAEIPPFSYAERVNGAKTQHVIGASVDLLQEIGRKHDWQIDVQLLPWARCLSLVASGNVELALNIGKSDAAANTLRLSAPYFTVHNVYYVSRRTHPQGLALNQLRDVSHYRLCGLGGYRFEDFGIATDTVDRGTTAGYEQLIQKLHLGRCDLFIESREIMAGQYLINPSLRHLLVDGTLLGKPLPGKPTRELYFAVSSHGAKADTILAALNQGLVDMQKTNELEKLLDRYLD